MHKCFVYSLKSSVSLNAHHGGVKCVYFSLKPSWVHPSWVHVQTMEVSQIPIQHANMEAMVIMG